MTVYPQVKENVAVANRELPAELVAEIEQVNAGVEQARVLVRPSGTEPVVRILAEAPTEAEAGELCARIATLVRRALG